MICVLCEEYKIKIEELETIISLYKCKYALDGFLDLSSKKIEDIIQDKYTEEYFLKGQKGLAEFIFEYIIRDDDYNLTYKCSNSEKHIFYYKDHDNIIQKDIGCKKLIYEIYPFISKRVSDIYKYLINKTYDERDKNKVDYNSSDESDYDNDELNNNIVDETVSSSEEDTENETEEDDDTDEDFSDENENEEINEIIAEEIFSEKEIKNSSDKEDEIDVLVRNFLEIRKVNKNKKILVDELIYLLHE